MTYRDIPDEHLGDAIAAAEREAEQEARDWWQLPGWEKRWGPGCGGPRPALARAHVLRAEAFRRQQAREQQLEDELAAANPVPDRSSGELVTVISDALAPLGSQDTATSEVSAPLLVKESSHEIAESVPWNAATRELVEAYFEGVDEPTERGLEQFRKDKGSPCTRKKAFACFDHLRELRGIPKRERGKRLPTKYRSKEE